MLQTTEEELLRKELGQDAPANGAVQEEILYKIDIPANRYDMLCLEGIATALNIFRKRIKAVAYQLADMSGEDHMPCHGPCKRGNAQAACLIMQSCSLQHL